MKLELNKVYRARNGCQWKIICNEGICFHGVNKKQDEIEIFWPNCEGSKDSNNDLIELVGNDFDLYENEKEEIAKICDNYEGF